jgi:hypothetical protein
MDIMRMGAGSHLITGVTMKTVTLDTVRPPPATPHRGAAAIAPPHAQNYKVYT